MNSEFGFKMKFFCILLTLIAVLHEAIATGAPEPKGDAAPSPKAKSPKNKLLLTSTRVDGDWTPVRISDVGDCIRIDLDVPGSVTLLPLCLKRKSPEGKVPGFHKNFKLRVVPSEGEEAKELGIDHILAQNKAVDGFVIGHHVSYVSGYINDDNVFYGTLAFRPPGSPEMVHCSILPVQQLSDFVNLSKMTPEKREKYMRQKTVAKFRDVGANAVVACGQDLHQERKGQEKHPFSFVKTLRDSAKSGKVKLGQEVKSDGSRQRRQAAPLPPGGTEDYVLPAAAPSSGGSQRAAPLPDFGPPEGQAGKTVTKEEFMAQKALGKLLKHDKHGTYYAAVCYIVDVDYLQRRFNGTPEEATLLLGGFVEMADWILRATDWDQDGVPDNIGVRLYEVSIYPMTRELKKPDEKWGREVGGSFGRRAEVFNEVRGAGTHMSHECDIRSGIAEINVAKYILHEPGGCTACKHHLLTSFVNIYAEKFSPKGEQLRLMYHQIRILTFGFVYTDSFCDNCAGGGSKGSPDNSDSDWGPCIVEGERAVDGQPPSSIPLNSFRLSDCSQKSGLKCLEKLVTRNKCLEFEPEDSYCGNGIVEGDEECDCGTLATCAEQECRCSPRSGVDPCRKLSEEESNNCFTLIRCRGFRFIHELGQSNGSNFLRAYKTFLEGSQQHMGESGDLGTGGSGQLTPGHRRSVITQALLIVITVHRFF